MPDESDGIIGGSERPYSGNYARHNRISRFRLATEVGITVGVLTYGLTLDHVVGVAGVGALMVYGAMRVSAMVASTERIARELDNANRLDRLVMSIREEYGSDIKKYMLVMRYVEGMQKDGMSPDQIKVELERQGILPSQ
ncbi:MAG: hypothetical protein HYW22_01445 [Candidatus Aenigmarchaeota archaeon]|nr:hypothetical protein [Candidatus Aenigmarchaeota archaeon]